MTKSKLYSQIKLAIGKSKNILLCLHPSPDEDSLGSCLAMFWYLKSIHKKPVVISGDSLLPLHFSCLPGFNQIKTKNFFQTNLNRFDLFLSLDSSSLEQISKIKPISFPQRLSTINIDHHQTNTKYADINLVDATSPATSLPPPAWAGCSRRSRRWPPTRSAAMNRGPRPGRSALRTDWG